MSIIGLLGPAVSTLTAAFLGACACYGFNRWQQHQETTAKRRELLRQLRVELNGVSLPFPDYDPGKQFYVAPIELLTPGLLLNGEVLTYQSHDQLLLALPFLQVKLCNYNDHVRTMNSARPVEQLIELLVGPSKQLVDQFERIQQQKFISMRDYYERLRLAAHTVTLALDELDSRRWWRLQRKKPVVEDFLKQMDPAMIRLVVGRERFDELLRAYAASAQPPGDNAPSPDPAKGGASTPR